MLQPYQQLQDQQPGILYYKFLGDRGSNSIRKAWDEFHGPVQAARALDESWPSEKKDYKMYWRRKDLCRIISAWVERVARNLGWSEVEIKERSSTRYKELEASMVDGLSEKVIDGPSSQSMYQNKVEKAHGQA